MNYGRAISSIQLLRILSVHAEVIYEFMFRLWKKCICIVQQKRICIVQPKRICIVQIK